MKVPFFENPTILMPVDRNELETQLFNNVNAVGFNNAIVVEKKSHLRQILKDDQRGLIISTIHKFDDILPGINTRKNIVVLIDEVHRTTGGKLGNYLEAALPNATIIGFTGTPIDKTAVGKGTFKIFSKYDAKGYLDKYSIAESIEDGTTLPLKYTLAKSSLLADKELLEKEFLDLKEVEGVTDFDELNRVLSKAVNLRNMLKSPERMDNIAQYVADHFRKNVEPLGYKAFLVAVDREACCLYKEKLDKYLPSEYSEVIISENFRTPELSKHYYGEDKEKLIRKAFRKADEVPKILIVTQKLLTGFDAPILYCMYLDKPMRDHTLLQAIARVNRPYQDEQGRKKPCGFILDFIGILNRLNKALAFDSADYAGVVNDIQLLKQEFFSNMKTAEKDYLPIVKGKSRDKAVEALLEAFIDQEKREKFYQFYRNVSQQFDIIAPDKDLVPYHKHMDILTRMYKILKGKFEGVQIDREFSKKVAELVRKHTHGGEILESTRTYEINESTLKKLEASRESDIEKIFNLARSIFEDIKILIKSAPFLIPIGERAQLIVQQYLDRQKSTAETLEDLKKIVTEMNQAKQEHKEKKIPTEAFTIYWLLKQNNIDAPEEKAIEVSKIMTEYKYWKTSRQHESKVRVGLYIALKEYHKENKEKVTALVNQIIKILKES
ncbi:MAG: type I restriction endonuclease subunit R [Candidatus Heimdallarchaeota archaeon]